MNEQEWLECTDPPPMLEFWRGKASERKLRLFVCACCRGIWHLLTDVRWRELVETMEQYADGFTSHADLIRASSAAYAASEDASNAFVTGTKKGLLHSKAEELEEVSVESMLAVVAGFSPIESAFAAVQAAWWGKQLIVHAALLRDIFGNPFRPVSMNPAWLIWNDGTVRRIAQTIYDERAFDRLPILADALEDAGCDNAGILNHCRSDGPHVRGCWVVDLILGKE